MVFSITARQASPFLRVYYCRLMNLLLKDTNIIFSITVRQALPILSCLWFRLINLLLKDINRVFSIYVFVMISRL